MIFLPERINVGYQERNDTYTGKLAYVIYYDNKGVLRKEKSWDGWRSKDIMPTIFENIPTGGFVINKKVGDYNSSWGGRKAWCRIYDPRNFEFEISVENLLYILENTNSIVGKGLEGEFVYGWSGKDLVLIPCGSPDYKEIKRKNDFLKSGKTYKGKDLIKGATYMHKNGEELIYVDRVDYLGEKYDYDLSKYIPKTSKKYIFYNRQKDKDSIYSTGFFECVSVGKILVNTISDICIEDYANVYEKMQHRSWLSPIDSDRAEYSEMTLEEFRKHTYHNWNFSYYTKYYGEIVKLEYNYKYSRSDDYSYSLTLKNRVVKTYNSKPTLNDSFVEELFNEYPPYKKLIYLQNGRLYREDY